jgi:hypothetical protein
MTTRGPLLVASSVYAKRGVLFDSFKKYYGADGPNSRLLTLPRNDRAVNQICSLECSTQRSGRDQITHPTHGHDDLSCVIAGVAAVAYGEAGFDTSYTWVEGRPQGDEDPNEEWRRLVRNSHLESHGLYRLGPFGYG